MGRKKVAVIGVGQQKIERRKKESIDEMVYDVTKKALADAGISKEDVDATMISTAVDFFCGINNAHLHTVDSAGAMGKPVMRNTVSGSTGVSNTIMGYSMIASGVHDIVLVICFEKMSENLSAQHIFSKVYDEAYVRPVGLNVPIQVSMEGRRYVEKYGITERQMAKVSVKAHGNAMKNPYAQRGKKLSIDDVLSSPYISWPVKLLDTSPVSDGAAALILAGEDVAKDLKNDNLCYIKGIGRCTNSVWFYGRRDFNFGKLDYLYKAAQQAYEQAGIKDPKNEIQVAEILDPFTFKELQTCEALGLCDEGKGGVMIDEGISELGGALPVNPSGGLLAEGNAIAATMMRICWLVRQIRGDAGELQVRNVRNAVTNGWGGMYQYGVAMVLGK
jgi:acetyl-CoA C-acetyltransferase